MRSHPLVGLCLLVCPVLCLAQVSGNIGYGQSGALAGAQQNERAKRVMTREEIPPTPAGMFVEANVLMNVDADEYVAVFGVLQEGATVADCAAKMDATIAAFTGAMQGLGVRRDDLFVDFVAQHKVYGYDIAGDTAKEKLAGFELKKNVSVRYKDYALLDKLVLAAAQSQIYDLIKVNYVVKDVAAVQDRLREEAGRVLKRKAVAYERLLGIRLRQPAQIYAERPSVYYPSNMYDSYTAYESEDVSAGFARQRYVVQGARKSRTFFYNALDASGFDAVINPLGIRPMVQCTLYLKARYETGTGAAAKPARVPASNPAKRTRG